MRCSSNRGLPERSAPSARRQDAEAADAICCLCLSRHVAVKPALSVEGPGIFCLCVNLS